MNMHWIYLVIFVSMIFTPRIISHDFYFINQQTAQEISIFILGTLGFVIFLWIEKQFRQNFFKRLHIQKEAHQISRELKYTYSYIGELNRKFDILKNILIYLPEKNIINEQNDREIFKPVLEAIQIFSKSEIFLIRFINFESQKILKEIRCNKKIPFIVRSNYIKEKNTFIFETDHYIIFNSPISINNMLCSIIVYGKNLKKLNDDFKIILGLATKSLCLFIYTRTKNPV